VNRRLTTRLARLEQAAPPPIDAPECRYHGTYCQLGANWPLDRTVVDPAGVQMDDFLDLLHQAHRKAGLPVGPHPRELWAVDAHERVPEAEIAQRDRETAEALAEAHAKNERILAELDAAHSAGG